MTLAYNFLGVNAGHFMAGDKSPSLLNSEASAPFLVHGLPFAPCVLYKLELRHPMETRKRANV